MTHNQPATATRLGDNNGRLCECCHQNPPEFGARGVSRFQGLCEACINRAVQEQPDEPAPDAIEQRLARAGVPRRYQAATLDDLPDGLAKAIGAADGVFLFGPVGTGKTHGMAATCRQHVLAGDSVMWVAFEDLLERIKASYGAGGESERSILSTYKQADVLCVDDIGVSTSEHATGILERLLRARYNAVLITHATSNLSPAVLAEKADPRVASIVRGLCTPINYNRADRRLAREAM